jgi:ABC-type bacteriocin/lantibiotic exporter with double-glycine peptidase domain
MCGITNKLLETYMNAVERVEFYSNKLTQEAPMIIKETRPSSEWPLSGAIKIDNLSVKYRNDLPLVLKSISINIKGGEKVGVVGRTG